MKSNYFIITSAFLLTCATYAIAHETSSSGVAGSILGSEVSRALYPHCDKAKTTITDPPCVDPHHRYGLNCLKVASLAKLGSYRCDISSQYSSCLTPNSPVGSLHYGECVYGLMFPTQKSKLTS